MTTVRISLPRWLNDSATKAVIAALTDRGGTPRFVGGCVRDALLGRPATDIDIATPLQPEEVVAAVRAAGLKAILTGATHGTVTVMADGKSFEVTTLRVDVQTDGRHARVEFTDDWRADAARRDFTMNALSAEPDGLVHDHFGGVDDALAGRVRFVGEPAERLAEDYLRLLRFFRFLAHYGRVEPGTAALEACRKAAPKLAGLSGERVRAELMKLLSAVDPAPTWQHMIDSHVSEAIIGEPGRVGRLSALCRVERHLEVSRCGRALPDLLAPDPLRRLASLMTGPGTGLADRLRLSSVDRERLLRLCGPRAPLSPDLGPRELHRCLYHDGRPLVADRLLLGWAEYGDEAAYRALLEHAVSWAIPAFPLKGRDAVELGVQPGPEMGRLLKETERWWREGDFAADREACRRHLRDLAGLNPRP